MAEYLLYFNQQWVGDHTEEWFRGRGPLAMAVVGEMKAAGVYVFAGGLEEEDGPVYQLRRWYEQFYVDKADVTPEMTERFEFEVDTTKANEYWRAEVAENLAKKAAEDEAPEGADESKSVGVPTAGGGV